MGDAREDGSIAGGTGQKDGWATLSTRGGDTAPMDSRYPSHPFAGAPWTSRCWQGHHGGPLGESFPGCRRVLPARQPAAPGQDAGRILERSDLGPATLEAYCLGWLASPLPVAPPPSPLSLTQVRHVKVIYHITGAITFINEIPW